MKLYLGGHLCLYAPQQQAHIVLEITEPTSLKEILASIGIPQSEVQIMLINDQFISIENTIVQPDDHVKLFSQIDGG